jgi:hypothetical protein
MPLRFFKRIHAGRHLRMNLSRRGVSYRIIFVSSCKAKLSPHRRRTPRISPTDSGQQITELGRGDRHRAVGLARLHLR